MTYSHYDIGDGNMPSIITLKQLHVAFPEQQYETLDPVIKEKNTEPILICFILRIKWKCYLILEDTRITNLRR